MELLESLLTLALLILLGLSSRILKIFAKEDIKVLSSFVYYFSLPALFFIKIAGLDLAALDPALILGTTAPILFTALVLAVLFFFKLLTKDKFILLNLSIVFGSNAFFGLAFFKFYQNGFYYDNATLTASLLGTFGIVTSLLLFEYAKKNTNLRIIFKSLLKNPLILAIAAGVLFSILKVRELFFFNAFELLGSAAASIAIFTLGIFLYDNFSPEHFKKALGYSAFRFVSLTAGVFLFIFLVPQQNIAFNLKQFLLFQPAIPAAISLVIFAQRYNYKPKTVTGLVVVTSLLSFIFIAAAYFIGRIL
jgi:predicted permease